jgi:hypothetical protein
MTRRGRTGGQALAEFALVFPIFVLVLTSVIVLGLYVFYNQQLENAAREAARYAAVHSATAQCPTVSRHDPILTIKPEGYSRCDAPENGWPDMTARARSFAWGLSGAALHVRACWSGFVTPTPPSQVDALPEPPNAFAECTIGGANPRSDPNSIPCPPPATTTSDDTASATVFANGRHYPTTVTVFACYVWTPPMSGFLFVPNQFTMRAVITEVLQRQQ